MAILNMVTYGGGGGSVYDLDVIIVGGGGGGGGWLGGGGGGGEVIAKTITDICKSLNICIGQGGAGGDFVYDYNYRGYGCYGCGGCQTVLEGRKQYIARGGCGGSPSRYCNGSVCYNGIGGESGNGCSGGGVCYYSSDVIAGGGGGGAGGNGCCGMINSSQFCGRGGLGLCGYGGGGGGGNSTGNTSCVGKGCNGGGNGGGACIDNQNPIYPTEGVNGGGGGGGGSFAWSNLSCPYSRKGCKGGDGIVEIRYKTDGSCGISCATGGTVTTDGDYTVHKFTADGTFCIVS